ncbi:MAG: acetate--CoA ligase family protein [Nitrospirae bacterium]|nr:acetate--CoA ligase family protein [Nitrospirota bacterium]
MLNTLFEPASIAVIGASHNPSKVGYALVDNLTKFGFKGNIYPVNPSGGSLKGLKVYPSLEEIKDEVQLALIAVPAPGVPSVLRDCIRKKAGSAIVVSAGFKESGSEGALLEQQLKEIAVKGKINLLGPNCLGIMNTGNNMNATFSKWMLPKGGISFFSQSGALGIAVLDWAIGSGIGFSKFISLGNKAALDETDFIRYLMNDEETKVILGYIEDVKDGKTFIKVAKQCTSKKPVILIKSGGTQAGARAASSHTGALAGSETAFKAAFRQTGIIRAMGVEELFDIAKIFSGGKIPSSDRIIIITNAGGPGIIATDEAENSGLALPILNKASIKKLSGKLPRNASLYNPVDVLGDATPERYGVVLDEVINSRDFDGLIVILTPQAMTDTAGTAGNIISASKKTAKPVVTSFMGMESVKDAVKQLGRSGIPNYPYPEDAIRSYKMLVDFSRWKKRKTQKGKTYAVNKDVAGRIIKGTVMKGRFSLGEEEVRDCLGAYGFIFPLRSFVSDKLAAETKSAKIGYPVVMKVSSPDILHKTDVGGVKTGIKDRKEAGNAFMEITTGVKRRVPNALIMGVNIYQTVSGGKEVVLGISYDRTFGHMLMFGLGGIYVEALRDVSFRIIPVTETDIREMTREIRSYNLLKGIRGEAPVDLEAIVESLQRLNQLITDFPEIQELDINPLVVKTKGAIALDARIIIHGG